MHAYTRIYTHIHAYARIYTASTRLYTHIHTYTRIYTHIHTYTRVYKHIDAYTRCCLMLSAAICCYLVLSAATWCHLLLSAAICCYLVTFRWWSSSFILHVVKIQNESKHISQTTKTEPKRKPKRCPLLIKIDQTSIQKIIIKTSIKNHGVWCQRGAKLGRCFDSKSINKVYQKTSKKQSAENIEVDAKGMPKWKPNRCQYS